MRFKLSTQTLPLRSKRKPKTALGSAMFLKWKIKNERSNCPQNCHWNCTEIHPKLFPDCPKLSPKFPKLYTNTAAQEQEKTENSARKRHVPEMKMKMKNKEWKFFQFIPNIVIEIVQKLFPDYPKFVPEISHTVHKHCRSGAGGNRKQR